MRHLSEYWVVYFLVLVVLVFVYIFLILQKFNPVAQKYTEREHWVMDEVLSKIKPECLKSSP